MNTTESSFAAGKDGVRLLIISPVRNEAKHIERVVRAMAAQTRPPDLWLVADDSSDDDTLQILRAHEEKISFMKVMTIPGVENSGRDRLAMALEARAFNRALARVDRDSFTHIGKLDGDIELPPDCFELLLAQMSRNPRLGITGGSLVEPRGFAEGWRPLKAPSHHVHGALRLFSRECFEAVGGIQERLGWDTIDETYARMRGFETERDRGLVARHHRPAGSADGRLRGQKRSGQCYYVIHYSLPWILLRSLKVGIRSDPPGISGLAFVCGYLLGALQQFERVEDEEFRCFARREHRRRMRRALRGVGG